MTFSPRPQHSRPSQNQHRHRPFFLMGLLLATALSAIQPRLAWAQDQAIIDKLVQMNKKAMDDYDTADFDTAKKALLDAEKTGKRAGLEGHPVMARTYIHLGALYLVGYKDKQKAQHYFGKALDIQPDIRLDRTLTSASVKDLFASVQAQKGGGGAADDALFPPASGGRAAGKGGKAGGKAARAAAEETAPPAEPVEAETAVVKRRAGRGDSDAEPELPATITALDCPYPDDTPPGKKVVLRCVAADSLGVAGVALFYKGFQMTDYEKVDMSKSAKGWWQANVPKKRVDGKSLQFYFEGLDASDKPVVSNGRAQSPNVMLIVEKGTGLVAVPAGDVEENPLDEQNRTAPRFQLGKHDDSNAGLDTHYGNRRFWIGLSVGTGFAYVINGVPESRLCGIGSGPSTNPGRCVVYPMPPALSRLQVTGVGWSRLAHLVPEIGFMINPNWAIAIAGRNQWIPQTKKVANYTASGANAVLLKVMRYTQQRRFRGYFGAAGGGGEGVRMNIQTDDQNPDLWDTIRVGGVLLGGLAGAYYELSPRFSWVAETNVFYGFPQKGFAFDISTGIQMNFGDTSGLAEEAAAKKKSSVSSSVDDEEPR